MEWISIKDRLPEYKSGSENRYLCVVESQDFEPRIDIRYFNITRNFEVQYKYGRSKVTHWMPLPDLPKAKD